MKPTILTGMATVLVLGATAVSAVQAQDLMDRAEAGETIRIGFANEVPWAYPGDQDTPLGFVNALALGVLGEMGITDIELDQARAIH